MAGRGRGPTGAAPRRSGGPRRAPLRRPGCASAPARDCAGEEQAEPRQRCSPWRLSSPASDGPASRPIGRIRRTGPITMNAENGVEARALEIDLRELRRLLQVVERHAGRQRAVVVGRPEAVAEPAQVLAQARVAQAGDLFTGTAAAE